MLNYKLKLFKFYQKYPQFAKYANKIINGNSGFQPENIKETDYIGGLGSPLIKKILQPDGQWIEYLPEDERQSGRNLESMACISFSLLNAIEILAKRKWGEVINLSDRFTAKNSGTSRNGNIQSRALDSVRKNHGSVNQPLWPNNTEEFNWNEFYASIPINIFGEGKDFIKKYTLGYEALWGNKQAIKEGLKYSPIYCAGYAWASEGGLYRSYGGANHAFLIVGYKEGEYWLAYDSYAPFVKKLAWDFQIVFPKLITLDKAGNVFDLVKIKKLLEKGVRYIMRADTANGGHGEIYKLDETGIIYKTGQELTNEIVSELGREKELLPVSEEYFSNLII